MPLVQDCRVCFFTKIQDQIKNPHHQDFSSRKETMYPKRMVFHPFRQKQPTMSTVFQRMSNTAADSVERLLNFHCILDNQLKDTVLDGPNEDESCDKICARKVKCCKARRQSCVAVLSLLTRTTEVLFVLQFYHPDKVDKVDHYLIHALG